MIHWLIQSLDDCPDALHASNRLDWLNDEERQRSSSFKVEKRRQEWLLGRWTAKNLVQSVLRETADQEWPLDQIAIAADADGAPYASTLVQRTEREETGISDIMSAGQAAQRLPLSLSISHSHGMAFCAIVRESNEHDDLRNPNDDSRRADGAGASAQRAAHFTVGADIEAIEQRAATFVADFFTLAEQERINAAPAHLRDTLATAIWGAKEAALKALREGLRIDTRRVTCHVDMGQVAPEEWTPFVVEMDEQLRADFPGSWSAWCRVQNGITLAIAIKKR